jgi:hypothetical protein
MPCMAAIQLPRRSDETATSEAAAALRARLRHEFHVEVPVAAWEGVLWLRVSAAPYTTERDFAALAAAVRALRSGPPSAPATPRAPTTDITGPPAVPSPAVSTPPPANAARGGTPDSAGRDAARAPAPSPTVSVALVAQDSGINLVMDQRDTSPESSTGSDATSQDTWSARA